MSPFPTAPDKRALEEGDALRPRFDAAGLDCDQDALWLKVRVAGDGGCCHTGRRSCFYRVKPLRDEAQRPLVFA